MTSEDYKLQHGLFDDLAYNYPLVGQKAEWKKVENFINDHSKSGSRTLLIIGDYGCGKTLLFNIIKEGFRKKKFKNSEKRLVVSLRVVEGEPETKIGLSFVKRAFQNIGYVRLQDLVSRTPNPDETVVDSNFQKILNGIRDKKRIAYDWLCGQTLSQKEKTELGISKNLITSSDALQVFFNFLKFLKYAGIDEVFLLIDEFEYVVTVYNEKQIDAILYIFKDIYDKYGDSKSPMAKTIFLIAMTPGCWDFLTNLEARRGGGGIIPWFERTNPEINQINLLPFKEKETETFLIERIKLNRIKYAENLPHGSWPFVRPEFFKLIHDKANGVPRKCLKYCDYVFDCGIRDNIEVFDANYTAKILEPIV